MKIVKRILLPVMAVSLAACATAPAPSPTPAAALPSFSSETAEYRLALEETIAVIESRRLAPARPRAAVAPAQAETASIPMPIPEHPRISSALALFTGRMRGDIQTYLLRSARYRKMIEKTLDEHRLPRELAWLPVIESGYHPTLTSRAGAHGVWQFMPDTAREYGMRVDWWVDERAEEDRSTKAAAEFLRDLYRQFQDWPLALAAYNAGPGRIRRALTRTGSTTFWELLELEAIPKETRGYVPTFFATVIIASDPETYGFRSSDPFDLDLSTVDLHGPVSLRYVAEIAEVEEKKLQEMNPALRRGVVPPGRWSVRVPTEKAAILADRAATLRNDDPAIEITSYTLRRGDTVRRLAKATGTTPETILAMNGLESPTDLRAGQPIYLPVRPRELGTMLADGDDKRTYYAVRKGDTLYSISKRYNLTIDELRDLNELEEGQPLRTGQRLRVSAPRAVTAGGM